MRMMIMWVCAAVRSPSPSRNSSHGFAIHNPPIPNDVLDSLVPRLSQGRCNCAGIAAGARAVGDIKGSYDPNLIVPDPRIMIRVSRSVGGIAYEPIISVRSLRSKDVNLFA